MSGRGRTSTASRPLSEGTVTGSVELAKPLGVATLVLLLTMLAALSWGTEPLELSRALYDETSLDRTILLLRAPRMLMAALAGGGLATVGSAYQGLLRNPLAEPYVLGVSGGAALGATLVIALGVSSALGIGATVVPAAAFGGGLLATLTVYGIARSVRTGDPSSNILLAGVMVNAVASALITFVKTLVAPSTASQLLRWLIGFVGLPSTFALVTTALYVSLGCAVLLRDAGRINLLALGDDAAQTLGVDVKRLERRTFIAASCVVGAIVSQTGLIGFVGLLVPHALRLLVGPDQRLLIPLSIVVGATLLIVVDLGARLSFRWLGTEPPVGAVTALLGGPAFLWILRRGRGPAV